MSELVVILNALILLGVVVSAILAVHCEKLLSSVIALGVTGIFAAAEFLLLHAPDVAISEAAVGAALTPLIFIVTIKKLKGGDDK
ncbi:MAG: hydrogenase subunit MbhD domain-containing protein [Oscillospiraceae bacterium]|jgi:energy-converting hydrogenase B subunit D|uniref:hydrogenase subunit MbhD domain-containing protein n=1 Tax=Candidatus Limivicinus sp. TaxID=3030905 RepID=UPI002EB65229|nr:hydrogenase subunit MbhD domain-containing protein [Oscillospiraceae bacterium]